MSSHKKQWSFDIKKVVNIFGETFIYISLFNTDVISKKILFWINKKFWRLVGMERFSVTLPIKKWLRNCQVIWGNAFWVNHIVIKSCEFCEFFFVSFKLDGQIKMLTCLIINIIFHYFLYEVLNIIIVLKNSAFVISLCFWFFMIVLS